MVIDISGGRVEIAVCVARKREEEIAYAVRTGQLWRRMAKWIRDYVQGVENMRRRRGR
jgi:hypothetical protein